MNAFIHCSLLHEYGHSRIFITFGYHFSLSSCIDHLFPESLFPKPFPFLIHIIQFHSQFNEIVEKKKQEFNISMNNIFNQFFPLSLTFSIWIFLSYLSHPDVFHFRFLIQLSGEKRLRKTAHFSSHWEGNNFFFSFSLNYLQELQ